MIGKEVLDKNTVQLTTVKEILKERKNNGKELTYEQKLTLDYSKKFAELTKAKSAKLLKELCALESFTDDLAIKFVDLLPETDEVAKLIINKTKVKDEDIKSSLDIVKKYLK